MVSEDFFTVQTIRFRILYVLLVLAHELSLTIIPSACTSGVRPVNTALHLG
jgi:hypothetical protein